jgi:hypothetical protein
LRLLWHGEPAKPNDKRWPVLQSGHEQEKPAGAARLPADDSVAHATPAGALAFRLNSGTSRITSASRNLTQHNKPARTAIISLSGGNTMHQFPPEPQEPDDEPLDDLDAADEDYEREEPTANDPATWVEFLSAADDTADEDALHGVKSRRKPTKTKSAGKKQPTAKKKPAAPKRKPASKAKPAGKRKAASKPKAKPVIKKKVAQKRRVAAKIKLPKRKPASKAKPAAKKKVAPKRKPTRRR